MSSLIKLLIIPSIRDLNLFNMRFESIQCNAVLAVTGAIEELPRKNSIRYLVSSPCKLEDGFENCLSFTK